ncbi:MAG: cupin domain-containing protein [Acidobacteriota bacterium]
MNDIDKIKIDKPWGYEILFAKTEFYAGKILKINSGEQLSLQFHEKKDETIYLYAGKMKFIVEEDGKLVKKTLEKGMTYRIKPGTKHRMIALKDCVVFEVSTPYLNDVIRLEDKYGREDKL